LINLIFEQQKKKKIVVYHPPKRTNLESVASKNIAQDSLAAGLI